MTAPTVALVEHVADVFGGAADQPADLRRDTAAGSKRLSEGLDGQVFGVHGFPRLPLCRLTGAGGSLRLLTELVDRLGHEKEHGTSIGPFATSSATSLHNVLANAVRNAVVLSPSAGRTARSPLEGEVVLDEEPYER